FTLDNVTNKQRLVNVNRYFAHHVKWNGTTASEIKKGGMYMLLLSDEATNTPTCVYNTRLSYYDN
ncbi:hypothetical protein, partial [Shewanella sp.]|uniref:hypothetical protein n=1 Tax=Shewanella sp. TaxID=50422 RepID=UPI004047B7A4